MIPCPLCAGVWFFIRIISLSDKNSQNMVSIAIDVMGGDFGPKEIIPAVAIAANKRKDVRFLLFGDKNKINQFLCKYKSLSDKVEIYHTDKIIRSDDKPSAALRASKGTSMRMAIEAVKEGKAQAVVSAGNTGALMALAKIVLKTVPGIHRPAIASVMPNINGDVIMLDLGANVLVDAENLVQFALLGSIFARAHKKIDKPRVGLLNIGSEDIKGPDHVRAAAEILSRIDFPGRYKGFVEGNDINNGDIDVIVCDGYAGNIALKTIEGAGRLIKHYCKESFTSSPLAMIGAFFSYFPLKALGRRMDPRLYNGGVFLGLNGLCIKSHGGADALGFSTAVIMAVNLSRQGYIDQVVRDISHLTDQESFISEDI